MTAPDTDTLAGLMDYDAGLLNDWGGGNIEWWQDYLRAEIGRANDHWRIQAQDLSASHAAMLRDFAERAADDTAALRAQAAKDKARIERLEAALRAQDEASLNAAALSAATPDGKAIPKHLMDQSDQLFARAERLRRAALEDGE